MLTSKKQRFVGSKELIDPKTGEVYPVQVNAIEDRDFNFHKIWLQHLINSFDEISNQKLRIAFWIIDHLDRENKLIMTQRAIADETNISLQTVNKTLTALQRSNPPFLVKINKCGAYRVNPDILWKGSYSNRMGVIYQYNDERRAATPEEPQEPQETAQKRDKDVLPGQMAILDTDGTMGVRE